jgi:hypothetical protein
MVPELCPLDKNNKLVSCWNFAFPHTNVLKLRKKNFDNNTQIWFQGYVM